MADEAVKKVAKDSSKMWIGGLSIVVVILLVVNFYYMKKLREKNADSGMGGSMSGGELGEKPIKTSTTTTSEKTAIDPSNVAVK